MFYSLTSDVSPSISSFKIANFHHRNQLLLIFNEAPDPVKILIAEFYSLLNNQNSILQKFILYDYYDYATQHNVAVR